MTVVVSLPLLVFSFIVHCAEIFWTRRLLGKPTPCLELGIFSLMQTATVALLSHFMPFGGLAMILQSVTHMTFQMWLFEAKLFPEALFGTIGPALLASLGEVFLPSLFLTTFGSSGVATLWGTTQLPFTWTALLPSLLLALYFCCKPNTPAITLRVAQEIHPPLRTGFLSKYGYFLPIVLLHKTCTLWLCSHVGVNSLLFSQAFFYSGSLMLPVICLTLLKYMHDSEKDQKTILYHTQKNQVQASALRLLREERHDFLNELTLISSYVQMHKWEEAQSCIAYAAATLADRYNYATLPQDAWLTVLELKQKEAQRRSINFEIQISADPPQNFMELRLLPKLIFNLVDNAFTAASKTPDPQVQLCWGYQAEGTRTLLVTNNGAPIGPREARKIFQGGFTSKKDTGGNSGWGLVICKRIAEELGGKLTFTSTPAQTTFVLTLPTPAIQKPHGQGAR